MLRDKVRQGLFIPKIEAYLQGRGRENLLNIEIDKNKPNNIDGLCNGASLLLLEKIFYDCLDQYYKIDPKPDILVLFNQAVGDFFNHIEAIIATDDNLLNSSGYQLKLGNRKIPEYIEINKKLDQAIKLGILIITEQDKLCSDYRWTLINLAEQQKILNNDEANILREEHIPDIPLFEHFISQIFLFQLSDENVENISQDNLANKFLQNQKTLLTLPILEFSEGLLITPEEFMNNLETIFPNERLVWIGLLKHTVAACRINNQYYYYDSNNNDKKFIFCHSPFIFTLKLALTILSLANADQKKISEQETLSLLHQFYDDIMDLDEREIINKARLWLENKPAKNIQIIFIKNAITILEQTNTLNEQSEEEWEKAKKQAVLNALLAFPVFLGLRWKVYRHIDSPDHVYPSMAKLLWETDFKKVLTRTDFAKETVLMKLASIGSIEELKNILLEINDIQIINMIDKNGLTALNFACLNKTEFEAAQLLLAAGANPNIPSKNGITPLMSAINNQNLPLVELLINYQADVNFRLGEHTAFTFSCLKESENDTAVCNIIFEKLLSKANINQLGQDLPPLFLCTLINNPWRVEQLLKHGADANIHLAKDSNSYLAKAFPECSILQYALNQNNLEIVKLLIKFGAQPNKNELQKIITPHANINNLIIFFVLYPCMAQGDTKAQQLSLLFQDYTNPPIYLGIFTTARHYITLAKKISFELGKDENKNLNDQDIKNIIMGHIAISGGYEYLTNGEFKKRVDMVFKYFLSEELEFSPQIQQQNIIN
jgi:ankyrin repeat protein